MEHLKLSGLYLLTGPELLAASSAPSSVKSSVELESGYLLSRTPEWYEFRGYTSTCSYYSPKFMDYFIKKIYHYSCNQSSDKLFKVSYQNGRGQWNEDARLSLMLSACCACEVGTWLSTLISRSSSWVQHSARPPPVHLLLFSHCSLLLFVLLAETMLCYFA